ncbi:MAG: FumA C-terminus/TtdB family hydratase beta subunit [Candidatus Omnitrophica bacterium]|nr:FumA C-terminus/TtdB family hydratase beta subunit [Candidatus Omnitrophota bacterium]
MGKIKKIHTPLDKKTILSLKHGDKIFLSGKIFALRDQAHLRITQLFKNGKKIPFDIKGKVIYYCGPTPAKNRIIGSCGPTTSGRMDKFTGVLLNKGLAGMIGKGSRSKDVIQAIKSNGAVYFIAPAGAGAYLSEKVTSCRMIAFKDLGPEAVYELEVLNFPLVVAVDRKGKNIYDRLQMNCK